MKRVMWKGPGGSWGDLAALHKKGTRINPRFARGSRERGRSPFADVRFPGRLAARRKPPDPNVAALETGDRTRGRPASRRRPGRRVFAARTARLPERVADPSLPPTAAHVNAASSRTRVNALELNNVRVKTAFYLDENREVPAELELTQRSFMLRDPEYGVAYEGFALHLVKEGSVVEIRDCVLEAEAEAAAAEARAIQASLAVGPEEYFVVDARPVAPWKGERAPSEFSRERRERGRRERGRGGSRERSPKRRRARKRRREEGRRSIKISLGLSRRCRFGEHPDHRGGAESRDRVGEARAGLPSARVHAEAADVAVPGRARVVPVCRGVYVFHARRDRLQHVHVLRRDAAAVLPARDGLRGQILHHGGGVHLSVHRGAHREASHHPGFEKLLLRPHERRGRRRRGAVLLRAGARKRRGSRPLRAEGRAPRARVPAVQGEPRVAHDLLGNHGAIRRSRCTCSCSSPASRRSS